MPESSFSVYRNFDFSGGLNIKDRTAEIAPQECVISQNWVCCGKAIEVLTGYTKFNTVPVAGKTQKPVKSMFRFVSPINPSVKKLIINCADSLFAADQAAGCFYPIMTGLDENAVFDYVNFGDGYCYMANGVDGLKKYNGFALYSIASSPQGGAVGAHYNRLIVSGGQSYPGRFYFSEPGNPEGFDLINNFQEVPSINGDAITKIVFFIDSSIIFKHNSIWRISGNLQPFPVDNLSDALGCPAPKSVISFEDKLFFISNTRHLYCYDRSNLINLTENFIGEIPVSKSRIKDVCAQAIDGRIWISYCDENSNDNFNNRVITCDISRFSSPRWFGPHKGFRILSFCSSTAYDDTDDTFFGDANTSTVWRKSSDYFLGADCEGVCISADSDSVYVKTLSDSIPADSLCGCVLKITGGTGAGQEKIVVANSEFSAGAGDGFYAGLITIDSQWDIVPDTGSIWEIGSIEARYRTGILTFSSPERQKLIDKVFVHAESRGDYPLNIEIIKNHLDSGNSYGYSLLGDSVVWDQAVFDKDAYPTQDMLDDYIDLDTEYAKYLNIEFAVSGRNRPALIYGFVILFQYDDTLNFNG